MASAARVFVVHVWSQDDAFRAQARAADAEQSSDFDDPQALVAFLHACTAPGAAPATGAPVSPTQTQNSSESE